VVVTGILSLFIAFIAGSWLFLTVSTSMIVGTAYSLPPIRLKRFALPAALCILTVRGVVVNLGLHEYFRSATGEGEGADPVVGLLCLFIVVFTVAIAIFKDVPDMEGDREYRITTFTLLLGKTKIFRIVLLTISLCYVLMIALGLTGRSGMNLPIVVGGHGALLLGLWWRVSGINLEEKGEIAAVYQFIWKLFFLEYLLFPLACIP
jgi:homogentisate phytyltransferase/homogentisate geranylgeranyltransferase